MNPGAMPPFPQPPPPPQPPQPKVPLYYRVNPCDIDRYKWLAPIGDATAAMWRGFTYGTECQCCLGTRLIVIAAIAFGLGVLL